MIVGLKLLRSFTFFMFSLGTFDHSYLSKYLIIDFGLWTIDKLEYNFAKFTLTIIKIEFKSFAVPENVEPESLKIESQQIIPPVAAKSRLAIKSGNTKNVAKLFNQPDCPKVRSR